jgi:hypothetical protein
MPDLYWSHLTVDDALNFGTWVLMVLMITSLALWFVYSIAQNVTKAGRRIQRSSYDTLVRENERLRDSLADAREENDFLRKLYRDPPPPADDEGRSAA